MLLWAVDFFCLVLFTCIVYVCLSTYVEIRRQLVGVISLCAPCGSQQSNSRPLARLGSTHLYQLSHPTSPLDFQWHIILCQTEPSTFSSPTTLIMSSQYGIIFKSKMLSILPVMVGWLPISTDKTRKKWVLNKVWPWLRIWR